MVLPDWIICLQDASRAEIEVKGISAPFDSVGGESCMGVLGYVFTLCEGE
jgi:hypothetical protein